ncbi:MAG: hypothetical protein D8M58_06290 [Calditrichaeota bacterium]|nr:MAG: hypothetical protein DWQ03_20215 [Calditrichota bacterium]MBL1204989.1 hypothetical protein [Calditrichota bacterium]NOG44819.1 hypothetical protein [Calditrichota bacterium]
MNTAKIITHNGQAHFDEFLAISLILARHEETHFFIERREPSEKELCDPNTWVIDIGERYEPHLKNFDHHQDLKLPASFVQVAEYLELEDILKKSPWWEFKDKIDRRGGFKMASELGIESLDPLNSPLENFFLEVFAQSPISMYQQMKFFGKKLIANGYRLKEQISFWENCDQLHIKDKKVIVGYTDETLGSVQYCESLDNPPAVRINYDGRGDGWSMSTIKDADGINFFRVQDHEHIKFAHRNGFMAKTKTRIPLENVLQLVEMSII